MKKIWIILVFMLVISLTGCNNISKTADNFGINSNQNSQSNSSSNNPEKHQQNANNQPVVLYYGVPLDTADQKINIEEETDALKKQQTYSKYEREYYLYKNNTFVGKYMGKIEGLGLDYYWQVDFLAEINDKYEVAISQSYNPYPRKIVNINSNLPKEFDSNGKVLNEINDKFSVNSKVKELSLVDLDGNGENEFLVLVVDENNYFFAKCLVDSKYQIVSYLTVFKEKYDYFDELVMDLDIFSSGEIFDINNDGVMEILVKLPTYEGLSFKVFTYNQGNFDGDFITQTTIKP